LLILGFAAFTARKKNPDYLNTNPIRSDILLWILTAIFVGWPAEQRSVIKTRVMILKRDGPARLPMNLERNAARQHSSLSRTGASPWASAALIFATLIIEKIELV
jgi:hypothetical protein